MSGRLAHLSVTAVVLLLGFLLVIQLRSQARPTEISSLSAQDLSTLIETLSDRNRQLRAAVADAREQLREYRVA
jgi:outer membrane murein-binding lipoprotein Lpp